LPLLDHRLTLELSMVAMADHPEDLRETIMAGLQAAVLVDHPVDLPVGLQAAAMADHPVDLPVDLQAAAMADLPVDLRAAAMADLPVDLRAAAEAILPKMAIMPYRGRPAEHQESPR
jgi:LmbE family N-acetylglucosaminyl deacetylase